MRIRKFNEDLSNEIDIVYISDCFADLVDAGIAELQERERFNEIETPEGHRRVSAGKWVTITIDNMFVNPSDILETKTESMLGETSLDRYIEEFNKINLILQQIDSSLEKIKIEYTDYEIKAEIHNSMFITIFPSKSI
jgi:hypothetical protein